MKISAKGLELIKQHEGCRLTVYRCPAGKPTVGYGHTGPDVDRWGIGTKISQQAADSLLASDVARFEQAVGRLVLVPVNQYQFDALVSFAFNLGAGALGMSTLLKRLNAGDYKGAAAEFGRWNKAGGKILPGLTRRRAAERALFEEPA